MSDPKICFVINNSNLVPNLIEFLILFIVAEAVIALVTWPSLLDFYFEAYVDNQTGTKAGEVSSSPVTRVYVLLCLE